MIATIVMLAILTIIYIVCAFVKRDDDNGQKEFCVALAIIALMLDLFLVYQTYVVPHPVTDSVSHTGIATITTLEE